MQFTHILFPFDYSEICRRAATAVRTFAQKTGAHLTVINVIADPSAEYPGSVAFLIPPKECEEMLEQSKRYLRNYADEAFPGCAVDTVCKMGNVAKHIVDIAKTAKVDLIMMPTRGCGQFRRLLLGSVTAKVLDDAVCPVWTDAHLQEHHCAAEFSAQNILCAVDAKDESVAIVRFAGELAGLYSANMRLVNVIPELDVAFKQLRPEFVREYHATAMEKIACLRERAGVQAPIYIEEGVVSQVIQNAAAAFDTDLIVIGRGRLQHFLGRLRTNAYAIIRDSPCPVLSV